MTKYCTKCRKNINEEKDKFCMLIAKKDNKIFEFECFHYSCWKSFFAEAIRIKVNEIKMDNKPISFPHKTLKTTTFQK